MNLLRRTSGELCVLSTFHSRCLSTQRENPFSRTGRILADDFRTMRDKVLGKKNFFEKKKIFPHYCDTLIVGGGVMGFSIAYWLQQRCSHELRTVVVEKDPTVNPDKLKWLQYQKCTSVLSVGGLRQQFSLKENIQLSLESAEFMRNIKHHLMVEGADPPDIQFNPCGYLFLASERGAEILQENYKTQKECGAKVELLTAKKIKENFPFINTEGIELGCHGLENEGWFDPWSLLLAFKRKAVDLGVDVVNGELKSFGFKERSSIYNQFFSPEEYKHPDCAYVQMEDGTEKSINFSQLIVAGGASSGEIGSLLGMGSGKGPLSAPLPIEPRKRFVYVFHCPDGPGLATPFVIDPTGAYVRREGLGGQYLCGISPSPEEPEPDCSNMDVDYDFFENRVWPIIANRVPAFEKAKMKSAWSGFYDFNTFDENAFIGPHPAYHNVYIVAGFSGHGIQQSPAVGRAVMEMVFDGRLKTIDVSRLGFDRYLNMEPLYESNIV